MRGLPTDQKEPPVAIAPPLSRIPRQRGHAGPRLAPTNGFNGFAPLREVDR